MPGTTVSGRRIRKVPLGIGEVIVVTGSGNGEPLALSTRTTFALTIRFRYVAETTRFSSSTKLMAEFMRGKEFTTESVRGTVRVHAPSGQPQIVARVSKDLTGMRRLARLAGQRVVDRPSHQGGVFAPEQGLAEADCGFGLKLAVSARPEVAAAQ